MLTMLRIEVREPSGSDRPLGRPGGDSARDATRDVVVEVDEHHRVADVAAAIAQHLGVCGAAALGVRRTGALLDPEAPFVSVGLVHGDGVWLLPADAGAARPPRRSLRAVAADVLAGPDGGTWTLLHRGRYTIGSGRSCDIVLADPAAARRHASVDVADDWSVTVESIEAPVTVAGHAIDGPVVVGPDDVVGLGGTRLAFRPNVTGGREVAGRPGHVDFQRTPYRPPLITDRGVQRVGPVPRRPDVRRFQMLTALAPLAGGLLMYAFSRQVHFLALTLLSPLVMIASLVDDRRSGRRRQRDDVAAFRDELVSRRAALAELQRAELVERRHAAPDLADLTRRAHDRTVDLWPRGRSAPDFLSLRIGTGRVPARFSVEIEQGGDDELRAEAAAALDGITDLDGAPIAVDVVSAGVVGIHGPDALVDALTSALVIQAACLHGPDDLTIVAAVPPDRPTAWMKWLPHQRSVTSPIAGGHLARGRVASDALVTSLLDVTAHRLDRDVRWPRILAVLDAAAGVDPADVARLLDAGPRAGISVLWTAPAHAEVPHQATQVIDLSASPTGPVADLWSTDPAATDRIRVDVEGMRPDVAERTARALAPIRDISTAAVTGSIPRTVDLLTAIGAEAADPGRVAERWTQAAPYGLRFTLGAGATGPVELDLVDDGPHALVAGTSGAGKSELLQSMVASLASRYAPDRLNFLFVDYKGGSASAVFADLPHTVGSVTNLDATLAMRALTSLRAELLHRMSVLDGRAKDLAEMLAVAPEEAPPSLVIVVDEFATLVKEIPEFVAGIVDVAQRGRSLGIHLVLATQRPAGAVNENILANTNLRISLRMLDRADSSAVLGVPDAADIPVPLRGRAIARLGAHQLVPFQCAYGGAPFGLDDPAASPVHVADFTAPEDASVGVRGPTCDEASQTQLHVVVAAAAAAHRRLRMPAPRRPWCEPLPDVVPLDRLLADPRCEPARRHPGRLVVAGLVDEPEQQDQRPLLVDLEDGGGCLVFGVGGSGKTTLLRTVATSFQVVAEPHDVAVLAFDFASRGLASLRELPVVLDVATGDDREAVTRHIAVLEHEIERRHRMLAAADAEHLTAYRCRHDDLPRLVLLIDGFGGMVDAFGDVSGLGSSSGDAWVERLVRVVADGRQVGIHAVVTADRRNSIPAKLHAAIANRIVLRHADEAAYGDHGVPISIARHLELSPGRGLWRNAAMVQIATVTADPAAHAQNEAVRAIGASGRRPAIRALRSHRLPELVGRRALAAAAVGSVATTPHRAVVGQLDITGEPAVLDITTSHAVVAGPPRSGRSTALRTIAAGLDRDHDVYRLGAASSGLGRGAGPRASFGRIADIAATLERVDNLFTLGEPVRPVVLVVDDADAIDDPALAVLWDRVLQHDALRIVASVETRTFGGFTTNPLVTRLKRARRVLVLQPDDPTEFVQLTGRKLPQRPGVAVVPGRGVLLADRHVAILQVACDDDPVRGGSDADGAVDAARLATVVR